MESVSDLDCRRKKRRQGSVGSVLISILILILVFIDADRGYLENSKEVEREDQGAQDLDENCRESMSPLSRLIRGFRNKYH